MPEFKEADRRSSPSTSNHLENTLQKHSLQPLETGVDHHDSQVNHARQITGLTQLQSMLNQCSKVVAQQQTANTSNQHVPQSRLGVIQGYFTKGHFGQRADDPDVKMVGNFVNAYAPHLSQSFSEINNSIKPELKLEKWIQDNLKVKLGEIRKWDIKTRFQQLEDLPDSWITSTKAHNPGGPPIVVEPETIDDPNSSGDEDMVIDEQDYNPDTDLFIDISNDKFVFWRNNKEYPITDNTRSEVRSGAMLTNSYVDFSLKKRKRKLIGKSTAGISNKTKEFREKEHKREKRHKGKTLSHHPDTFWTQNSYSEMGWHPVGKHTNTLEGDQNNLGSRINKSLSGIVIKEKNEKLLRPTLSNYEKHRDRAESSEYFIEELDKLNSDDIDGLLSIVEEVEILANTENIRKMCEAIKNVLETAQVKILEGEQWDSKISAYFLSIEYNKLDSTSVLAEVLHTIVEKMTSDE